jgi:hypothetical protein
MSFWTITLSEYLFHHILIIYAISCDFTCKKGCTFCKSWRHSGVEIQLCSFSALEPHGGE